MQEVSSTLDCQSSLYSIVDTLQSRKFGSPLPQLHIRSVQVTQIGSTFYFQVWPKYVREFVKHRLEEQKYVGMNKGEWMWFVPEEHSHLEVSQIVWQTQIPRIMFSGLLLPDGPVGWMKDDITVQMFPWMFKRCAEIKFERLSLPTTLHIPTVFELRNENGMFVSTEGLLNIVELCAALNIERFGNPFDHSGYTVFPVRPK
jgi:hypothetical protein